MTFSRSHDREFDVIEIRAPFGGLFDGPVDDLVSETGAIEAVNCQFTHSGIEKRLGYDQPYSTAAHKLGRALYHWRDETTTNSEVLAVWDKYLYKVSGTDWVGAVSGGATAGSTDEVAKAAEAGASIVGIHQYADWLFFVHGANEAFGMKWYYQAGPAVYDWGWRAGALTAGTNVSATAGSKVAAKAYKWMYVPHNSTTGHKANPSAETATFTGDTGQNITIPANASWQLEYDEIYIYVTEGNGEHFKYEKTVSSSGIDSTPVATTIIAADGDLTDEVETDNTAPDNISLMTFHAGRFVGFNTTTPRKLLWSKSGNVFSWPPVNAIDIARENMDENGGIFVLDGQLYVVKRFSGIYRVPLRADGTYAPPELVVPNVGCAAHYSIVVDDSQSVVYWWDARGIVKFNGVQAIYISEKIAEKYNEILGYHTGAIPLYYVNGQLEKAPDKHVIRWVVPSGLVESGGGTSLTNFLCYDTAHDSFYEERAALDSPNFTSGREAFVLGSFFDIGPAPTNYVVGVRRIAFTDTNGFVYRIDTNLAGAKVYLDNSNQYEMKWASRWFGDGISVFMPRFVEVELKRSATGITAAPFNVYLFVDGKKSWTDSAVYQDKDTLVLFDANDTDGARMWKPLAVNWSAPRCNRFSVGLQSIDASGSGADITVSRIRIYVKRIGPGLPRQ